MLKLFCAIIGVAGSAFSVRVDESDSVDDLKKAIKAENSNTIKCDAKDLRLFLAKKGDTWLLSRSNDIKKLKKGEKTDLIKALTHEDRELDGEFGLEDVLEGMPEPKTKQIHVLVVVPSRNVSEKRVRVDEWFVDKSFSVQKKKRRLDEDETDQFTRYFKMAGFPPLAHTMMKYTKIVERDAYVVIFEKLMCKVKSHLKAGTDANMVVTGNPGTGKSRFYLYFIFQLVFGHQDKVKELPLFDLVLNFGNDYHIYDAESNEFIELTTEQVRALRKQDQVLRLIEGKSSELTGWKGVSILFASPGLVGMNDYTKVDSLTYILPVWNLKELQDYNSLLDDVLKLSEDVLIARYSKFGGIPRFIFTGTEKQHTFELHMAISTFSALDILSYAKKNHGVRDGNYSHRILAMVPSNKNFLTNYHLDFLSNYIANKIVAGVREDSLQRISEFAIAHANDDSGSTSVVLGKIYEMLSHRWFNLPQQKNLQLRSLFSTEHVELIVPENMSMEWFSTLDEIRAVPSSLTYYQPTFKNFGALDAFILDGENTRCYGLQMTLNLNHGIKATPLSSFLRWLNGIGIPTDQFYFSFVVPSDIERVYKKQTIRTKTNEVHLKPGTLLSVKQYVVAVNVLLKTLKRVPYLRSHK